MSWFRLLGIAVALAADAFAVAVVTGLSLEVSDQTAPVSLEFSLWSLSGPHAHHRMVDRPCSLRAGSGGCPLGCICTARSGGRKHHPASLSPRRRDARSAGPDLWMDLVFLSVATSIDALAVGLSLAMIGVSITVSASVVGFVAAALTLVGNAVGQSCQRHVGQADRSLWRTDFDRHWMYEFVGSLQGVAEVNLILDNVLI